MKTKTFRHFYIPAAITTLPNGLTVASCQIKSVLAEAYLTVALGSGDDGAHPGIAHFIEHMLFEGPTRDSVHPLLRPLARKAIYTNACTSTDHTSYEVSNGEDAAELLEALLGITKGIIASPKVMELERKVILQEIEEGRIQSRTDIWHMQTLYPHVPGLHYTPDGNVESVKALTLANLRKSHGHWYGPSNSLIQVASGLPHEAILKLVEKSSLGKAPGSDSLRPRPVITPKITRAIHYDTHESDEIGIYTPLPDSVSAQESILLAIVCELLTSSPFGLLYRRLRTELSAVYGISALQEDIPGQPIICHASTQRGNMQLVEDEYNVAILKIFKGEYSDELFESVINQRRKQLVSEKEKASLRGCLPDLEQMWLKSDYKDIDPLQIIDGTNRASLAQVAAKYLLEKPYGCLKVLEGKAE